MPEGLEVSIGANLGDAIKQVQLLTSGVIELSKATAAPITLKPFNTSAIGASVAKLKTDIGNIGPAASAAGSGLSRIKPGADQANFALLNLGRVVQDAPFGFLGISNNINPLLESFQRLKVSTGTTGGALKALVGSLAGPAGIGLAVSAATSLLVVFGDKLFGAKTNAEGLTTAQQKAKDAVDGVVEAQAKEIAQVSSLVSALQSGALSRNKQVDAIKELQKIAPDYFGKLDTEKIKITDIAAAYNQYTNSIIGSIEAQIKTGELTEAIKKRLDLQKQYKDATAFIQAQIAAGKSLDDINKSLADEKVVRGIETQLRASDNQVRVNGRLSQTIKDQAAEAKKATVDRVEGIGAVVVAMLQEQKILSSIDPKNIKINPGGGAEPDPLKDAIKNLEDYQRQVGLTSAEFQRLIDLRIQLVTRDQQKLGLDDGQLAKEIVDIRNSNELLDARKKSLEEVAKSVQLLKGERIEKLNLDFEISLNDLSAGKIDTNQAQRLLDAAAKDANLLLPVSLSIDPATQARLKATGLDLPIVTIPVRVGKEDLGVKEAVTKINTELALADIKPIKISADTSPASAALSALNASINATVQRIGTEAFATIGTAIGTALGGGDLKSVFGSFINVLADGLKEIGRAMIAYATARIILAKISQLNPSIALIAGIGLVAAGAALETAINRRKFATGGIITKPTNALIGEQGPEVVFPLSDLNTRLRQLVGRQSNGGEFVASTSISGDHLNILINRSKNKFGSSF